MELTEFIKQKFNVTDQTGSPVYLKISRLKEFPDLLRELKLTTGAEIGVSTGYYSKWLFSRIRGLKLYCIDPWIAYPEYVEHHTPEGQVVLNQNFEKTKERLAGKNAIFIKKYSMDAVKDFADESLDFVFIDGNHSFEFAVNDIAEWSKKVKKGGIIAGHDYWNSIDKTTKNWLTYEGTDLEKMKLCQVKYAVDAFTIANKISPLFITNNEKCPSYFWVKELQPK